MMAPDPRLLRAKALCTYMIADGEWIREYIPQEEAARSHDSFMEAVILIALMGDFAHLGLPKEVETWWLEVSQPPPYMYI